MPKIQATKIYSEIDLAKRDGYTTVSLQGSSRSSKTYNALTWLIIYCLQHPNTRLSVVRATLPAIKGSVFIDFKEILMNMLAFDEKQMNKTELTYRFPNGSWVEFFSTDSEQKLRGRKRDVLFVNEANELSFIEWQQLKMRTTQFTVIDYNPSFSDEHWICRLNNEAKTKHVITTYKDNPFLEQTIIDEIESLQHKNDSLWKIYGLGIQAQIEGLIFKNVELIDTMPPAKRIFAGMDFGFTNDPTAIVEVAITENEIYVNEICYKTEMVARDIIRVINDKCPGKRIISESADPRLIREIHNAGINIIPVEKFPGSIEAGINKMLEYKICVTQKSYNVIKELKNYTYRQDKDGNWLNQPIDAFNHAIDAIRYIVLTEALGKAVRKPLDKDRLRAKIY
jgi:phage terminase large subunit